MKYAYFPGCSADSTGISFTLSAQYVCSRMGMELVEIPDWCCCGASAALVTDHDLSVALPARSLALAEKMDPSLDVVVPCAGCYSALKSATHFARASEQNREMLEDLIEMPFAAHAEVSSLLELLSQPQSKERIAAALTDSLGGLKVASYYGCALVRPKEVCRFDNVENPQSMDSLMKLAGAEPVDWAFKTECCGASHHLVEPKAARPLVERILEDAAINGAEAIVTACPLCNLNLDMREKEINKKRKAADKPGLDIPVFYFTELLGLAMGGSKKQLGINKHFWQPEGVLQKIKQGVVAQQAAALEKAAAEKAAAEKAAALESKQNSKEVDA